MSSNLNAGDLAIVIAGKGANNVRNKPNGTVNYQIPEHAVVAILDRPARWSGAYPYRDGSHDWWYVRGRTETKRSSNRFEVIEGWTVANQDTDPFLERMEPTVACHDTMGTALDTHLQAGMQVYVLPPEGVNIRSDADPHATRLSGLRRGSVVTVVGIPACVNKMVWWQVQRIGSSRPAGWVSEGNILEWFLAALTLE